MFEESLRGEAVSMQHTFFLDGVCRLARRYNVRSRLGLPFFSVPFLVDGRIQEFLTRRRPLIGSLGIVEQVMSRNDFSSDSEGSS
jgi:hypothetical protein